MKLGTTARVLSLGIILAGSVCVAANATCGEATCVSPQGAYISHFTGTGCTGTESYYLPYDSFGYQCRPWDGGGLCGTTQRTVTNRSYRDSSGTCHDAWPSGNTLTQFVTVYRTSPNPPPVACGYPTVYSGTAPLSVWFYGTCSYDPDGGSITNYQWDLWEGIDWGSVGFHTFYYPGSYPIWLTVWDDEGQPSSTYIGTIWVQ
ncbi:MAG TPA: PKD domain-containing protein [Thermoanaerobaculia bacterium]|jgi:hypothetical protein|nr:PKD domain-containing protein [Thermoanaerobaculia bacterium]